MKLGNTVKFSVVDNGHGVRTKKDSITGLPLVDGKVPFNALHPSEWNNENLKEAGVSLRNSLFATLITVVGLAVAAGLFYELDNQTKANNASMDMQGVVTGLTNAYGSNGGYPASVDFQTLEQEGDFPSDGTPSTGNTATFNWGTITYNGNTGAGGNTGAHFNMNVTPNNAADCVSLANGMAGMAEELTVGGTTVIKPNTTPATNTIATDCGTGTAIVFYGG